MGKGLPKGSKLPPVSHGSLWQAHETGSFEKDLMNSLTEPGPGHNHIHDMEPGGLG